MESEHHKYRIFSLLIIGFLLASLANGCSFSGRAWAPSGSTRWTAPAGYLSPTPTRNEIGGFPTLFYEAPAGWADLSVRLISFPNGQRRGG